MKTHRFLKGRVTALLLALCMAATLLPMTVFAAGETQTADFSAGAGSEALALLNANKTSGAEDSAWESTTNTLTLKGVNFSTSADVAMVRKILSPPSTAR